MYPALQPSYFNPSGTWQSQASSYFNQPSSMGQTSGIPGIATGIGALVGGFNNGSGQMQDYLHQGQDAIQHNYDQGLSYLDPYQQAGANAINPYQQYLQQMQNPSQFYNNTMANYHMSPAAQFQLDQGTQAANHSAAAAGNVGTPAAQKALMRYSQGLSNQDMQQYFQNQMGIHQQYGQGLQGLMNQGFNAGSLMNQNRMGLGNELSQIMQNQGVANMYGQQSKGQGIMGALGGIASLASKFF